MSRARSEGAPECPSPAWQQTSDGFAAQSAVLTVEQGGAVILTMTCAFATPTADGRIAPGAMTCSSH